MVIIRNCISLVTPTHLHSGFMSCPLYVCSSLQESEKRRKSEEHLKHLLKERIKPVILGGPDYEVGLKQIEFDLLNDL